MSNFSVQGEKEKVLFVKSLQEPPNDYDNLTIDQPLIILDDLSNDKSILLELNTSNKPTDTKAFPK